ncbi:hypothetical protein FRC08_015490, partial [Ceratobasidium sp. 394]
MSTTLPPWDSLGFTFGTEPELNSIAQCANVTFDYYNTIDVNTYANPPPTAPYSIVIYGAEAQTLNIPLNNSATSGQYKWRVNLPAGQSYAVSMKDAKGYSGGILSPLVKVTPGAAGCNPGPSPIRASSLDVSVSGNSQCGLATVAVNNGTAPYTIEFVPADNRQQKTIHFATSPFNVVLDMSAGVEYFLALYDSAGHSSVKGVYTIAPSSDNSCLGAATTISAGMFSTLYPGGTSIASATVRATAAPGSASSSKLSSGAVIGIAVAIPVVVIVLALLALWFCYRRNRRQKLRNTGEKPEIDQFDPPEPHVQGGYTPVPTAYFGAGPTGSYHDLSNASGSQHPLAAASYTP